MKKLPLFFLPFLISCGHLRHSKKLIKEGHSALYTEGALQIPATEYRLIPAGPSALELAQELAGLQMKKSFFQSFENSKKAAMEVSEDVGSTFQFSKELYGVGQDLAKDIRHYTRSNGKNLFYGTASDTKNLLSETFNFSVSMNDALKKVGRDLADVREEKEEDSPSRFEWRREISDHFQGCMADSWKNYFSYALQSFQNAESDFSSAIKDQGFSLATLKASRWIAQGIFWDGVIAPAGKIGYGSVGYFVTNAVAYPTVLIADKSIDVAWTGVGFTRIVLGKSVQYGVAPVLSSSSYLVGSASGILYGMTEGVVGGVTLIGGEVLGGTVQIGSAALGSATLALGSVGSVIKGGLLGSYELSSMLIMPAGYELSSGVVVGYATFSQIAAHSILAVGDLSYMMLSFEGPGGMI